MQSKDLRVLDKRNELDMDFSKKKGGGQVARLPKP
jgi:hypothetical protein